MTDLDKAREAYLAWLRGPGPYTQDEADFGNKNGAEGSWTQAVGFYAGYLAASKGPAEGEGELYALIDKLCKLGNGDVDGNSDGNRIAQEARALLSRPSPQSPAKGDELCPVCHINMKYCSDSRHRFLLSRPSAVAGEPEVGDVVAYKWLDGSMDIETWLCKRYNVPPIILMRRAEVERIVKEAGK